MENLDMNTQEQSGALVESATNSLILDYRKMEMIERFAGYMCDGVATVPDHLRGNRSDCFAVTLQAVKWGMDPFAVAQKTHFVSGKLGYEAQLVNAVIVSSSKIIDRAFHMEWFGEWKKVVGKFVEKTNPNGKPYKQPGWNAADEDGLGVRIWATLRGEQEPRVLELLLTQAQVRNSTLWASDPKQQLAYLAQKRWARLYAPDVILGVYSPDELEQEPKIRDINVAPANRTAQSKSFENVVSDEPAEDDHAELSTVVTDFMAAFKAAETVEQLNELSGSISDAIANGAISSKERSELMEAFKARKKALSV